MKSLLFPILLSLSACTVQTLYLKNANPMGNPSATVTSHFVFWGLWQDKKIDLIEECYGETPLKIRERYNFWNLFVSLISVGIYNPRTSEIWCEVSSK